MLLTAGSHVKNDGGWPSPFVVSLSNHGRPFDGAQGERGNWCQGDNRKAPGSTGKEVGGLKFP